VDYPHFVSIFVGAKRWLVIRALRLVFDRAVNQL